MFLYEKSFCFINTDYCYFRYFQTKTEILEDNLIIYKTQNNCAIFHNFINHINIVI